MGNGGLGHLGPYGPLKILQPLLSEMGAIVGLWVTYGHPGSSAEN